MIGHIARLGKAVAGHWTMVALAALSLCSCQSTVPPAGTPPMSGPPAAALPAGALAMAGARPPSPPLPYAGYADGNCPCPGPLPIPYDVKATACASDELLCDGGDHHLPVMVSPDWRIYGLDMQDTVMHFDTLDGRTLVQPSNCTCIYAPRFSAVRSVARLAGSEQIDVPNGMMLPEAPARQQELKIPASSLQRYQARGEVGRRLPEDFVTRINPVPVSSVLRPVGFQDTFLPYENLEVIRRGIFVSDEKARLAQAIEAAIVWTDVQAVQVTISGRRAEPITGDQRAQATFSVKDMRNCPRLRVLKVASSQTARPGDTVDFTIRFDNLGDQPLGNLVLVDHLTTRLQYVPGSAQSSVETRFTSGPDDGKSLVLRWEITEPLDPGDGGLVRFRCKVL